MHYAVSQPKSLCHKLVPDAHGMGRQRQQKHPRGPGIAWVCPWMRSATPPRHDPIQYHFPVFTPKMCVFFPLLGYATTQIDGWTAHPRAVPDTMHGCHHVTSLSESFYARSTTFFGMKNYSARRDIVSSVFFRRKRQKNTELCFCIFNHFWFFQHFSPRSGGKKVSCFTILSTFLNRKSFK